MYCALKHSLPGRKAVNVCYCTEEGNVEEKKEVTLFNLPWWSDTWSNSYTVGWKKINEVYNLRLEG